jgi:Transposase
MDGSREKHKMTAGLDLGDEHSYLCLLDTESGEAIEEGRLRTTPEALRRRFEAEPERIKIAIEVGTHSPWVSRLLEGCGHEVLVANARKVRLIYGSGRKSDKLDALRSWLAWLGSIPNCCARLRTGARTPRPTWRSSTRAKPWYAAARS